MIIEKEYICDHISNNEPIYNFYSLRDYHRKIIGQMIHECDKFATVQNNVVLFIGIEIYIMISESESAPFQYFTLDGIKNNPEHIGFFRGYKVYHDLRLSINKAIFGSTYQEINQFITTKERRKKLEKLNTTDG